MVNAAKPDPSPSEIAALCLEIQAAWSDEERLKRMRIDWRPAFVRCDDQLIDMDLKTYESHHENHEILNAA
jgi:hypothetical protein